MSSRTGQNEERRQLYSVGYSDCRRGRIVDFVVAGLGFGALIVVIGFVIRDLGPLLWKRLGHGAFSNTDEERERWRSLCHAVSTILTLAGCVVLIATVAAVLVGVSDSAGEITVIGASIVAIVGMVMSIGLTARNYRQSAPEPTLNLGNVSRQSALVSNPLKSNSLSSEVTSVRRVEKQSPAVVAQTNNTGSSSSVTPVPVREANIDEPFDATKLLPSEFDEHYDPDMAEPTSTTTTASTPANTDPKVEQVVAANESTGTPAEISQEKASKPSNASVAPVSAGAFRSRVLADIGAPEPAATVNGSFASSMLADVDKAETAEEANYQSPLLADLAAEPNNDEEAKVETSTETQPVASETEAIVDGPPPANASAAAESATDEVEESTEKGGATETPENADAKTEEPAVQR